MSSNGIGERQEDPSFTSPSTAQEPRGLMQCQLIVPPPLCSSDRRALSQPIKIEACAQTLPEIAKPSGDLHTFRLTSESHKSEERPSGSCEPLISKVDSVDKVARSLAATASQVADDEARNSMYEILEQLDLLYNRLGALETTLPTLAGSVSFPIPLAKVPVLDPEKKEGCASDNDSADSLPPKAQADPSNSSAKRKQKEKEEGEVTITTSPSKKTRRHVSDLDVHSGGHPLVKPRARTSGAWQRVHHLATSERIPEDPESPFADLVALLRSYKPPRVTLSTLQRWFERMDNWKVQTLGFTSFKKYTNMATFFVAVKLRGRARSFDDLVLVLVDNARPFLRSPPRPPSLYTTPTSNRPVIRTDPRKKFLGGNEAIPKWPLSREPMPVRGPAPTDDPFSLLVSVIRNANQPSYFVTTDRLHGLLGWTASSDGITAFELYEEVGAFDIDEYIEIAQRYVDLRVAINFDKMHVRLGDSESPYWLWPRSRHDIPPLADQCFVVLNNGHTVACRANEGTWIDSRMRADTSARTVRAISPSKSEHGRPDTELERRRRSNTSASTRQLSRDVGPSLPTSSEGAKRTAAESNPSSKPNLPELVSHRATPFNAIVDWLLECSRQGYRLVSTRSFQTCVEALMQAHRIDVDLHNADTGSLDERERFRQLLLHIQRFVDLRLIHGVEPDSDFICIGDTDAPYWSTTRQDEIPSYDRQVTASKRIAELTGDQQKVGLTEDAAMAQTLSDEAAGSALRATVIGKNLDENQDKTPAALRDDDKHDQRTTSTPLGNVQPRSSP